MGKEEYAEKLAAGGLNGSRAVPTKVRLVVHADDFTISGTHVQLEKMRGLFKKWYDEKDRGIMQVELLGHGPPRHPGVKELCASMPRPNQRT